ncbi:hypothetical protein CGK74_18020 [Thauera propionica]|uniref:Uncharacterized protein n=1 Tax=Thauera propionica TaxID=2019431 RepID=A0A235EVK0_9RHOO|nr:hypothetical protein [Thauera propionica]OYD52455.1 hypothetical protein CGK74_18020 [Thauera propionica]
MQLNAQLDILPLVEQTTKAQRNLAYSAVQGINATAKQIQDAQREQLNKRFTLRTGRTKQFLERQAAVIKPWASVPQGRLYAEVAVGQRQNLLLSGFERGDEREPVRGKLIAQPVTGNAARPSFGAQVAKQFTFTAMRLKAQQTAGGKQFKGRAGTFTIEGVGVFLRTGKKARDVELLYAYARKQTLPRKLGWLSTGRGVADRWLSENITQAFLRSLPRR